MKRSLVLLLPLALFSCSNAKTNEATGLLIGPAAAAAGGAYKFQGYVDRTYTTNCGNAGAAISSGTSGSTAATTPASSSSSSSSSNSKEKEQTTYGITSYLVMAAGETISMKFDYHTDRTDFSFTPQTAVSTTCTTDDFSTCLSTGRFTCTTTDNLTCGGTYQFLFKNTIPLMFFQAQTGTLSWKKAFSLNGDNNAVNNMTLDYDLVGTDGSIFTGTISCNISQ